MEDSHIANIELGDGKFLFGVFDGHGGKHFSSSLNTEIYTSFNRDGSIRIR